MTTLHLVAIACLGAAACAQSLMLAAPFPITATAQDGAVLQTLTLPSGPLPPSGNVFAHTSTSAPTPYALLAWTSFANDTQMSFVGTLECSANTQSTGQASVVPGQFLLELTTPTSTPVTIVMNKSIQATAGAPTPVLRIDIGDDGYFECTEFTPNTSSPAVLSATPLRIRVQLSAAVTAPAEIVAGLQLLVRPDNHTTSTLAIAGCGFANYTAVPTFAGNLSVGVETAPQQLAVAVFGLGWQPLVLNPGTTMPCILLPTVDHVLFAPSGTPITLVIPPAARPLVLWTQAVAVSTPFHPSTTAGYTVAAW